MHSVNNMKKRVRIVWCFHGLVFLTIPHLQLQDINNETLNSSNVNATLQLCTIVDSYYQVKAVDNNSNIYSTLENITNDTLTFWVSFMLPSISYACVCYSHKLAVAICMNILNDLLNLFLHAENCILHRQLCRQLH